MNKWPFFSYAYWKKDNPFSGSGFWFRILGYGLHFTDAPPLFSERNGYTKKIKLPFGFRMGFLKRK